MTYPTQNSRLPPGWSSARDPRSGKTYYINNATHKTQWEAPEGQPSQQPKPVQHPVATLTRQQNQQPVAATMIKTTADEPSVANIYDDVSIDSYVYKGQEDSSNDLTDKPKSITEMIISQPEDTAEDATEDTTEDTTDNTTDNTTEDTTENITENTTVNTTVNTAKDTTRNDIEDIKNDELVSDNRLKEKRHYTVAKGPQIKPKGSAKISMGPTVTVQGPTYTSYVLPTYTTAK